MTPIIKVQPFLARGIIELADYIEKYIQDVNLNKDKDIISLSYNTYYIPKSDNTTYTALLVYKCWK